MNLRNAFVHLTADSEKELRSYLWAFSEPLVDWLLKAYVKWVRQKFADEDKYAWDTARVACTNTDYVWSELPNYAQIAITHDYYIVCPIQSPALLLVASYIAANNLEHILLKTNFEQLFKKATIWNQQLNDRIFDSRAKEGKHFFAEIDGYEVYFISNIQAQIAVGNALLNCLRTSGMYHNLFCISFEDEICAAFDFTSFGHIRKPLGRCNSTVSLDPIVVGTAELINELPIVGDSQNLIQYKDGKFVRHVFLPKSRNTKLADVQVHVVELNISGVPFYPKPDVNKPLLDNIKDIQSRYNLADIKLGET